MDLDELTALVGRAWAVRARGPGGPSRAALAAGVEAIAQVRAVLDGLEVDATRALAAAGADPEVVLAEAGRVGWREAERVVARAAALDAYPALAEAVAHGLVSGAHVDAVAQVSRSMEPGERALLAGRDVFFAGVAQRRTPADLAKTVRAEAARLSASDGEARLARQRRATSLRTWVEKETGMWCGRFAFDPASGLLLDSVLSARHAALFAEAVPDTAPTDPMCRQAHLRALALRHLLLGDGVLDGGAAGDGTGDAGVVRDGVVGHGVVDARVVPAGGVGGVDARVVPAGGVGVRVDVALVIDLDRVNDAGEPAPAVDVGLPIGLPISYIRHLCANAVINPVVLRNGVVVGGVGELDRGRRSRLANRAQRRVLRALYPTCAIEGCDVPYAHTKPHHVIWWRRGGLTNLDNLLPLCSKHHHNVHDDGWQLKLLPDRTLVVTFPDGSTMRTGPPRNRGS